MKVTHLKIKKFRSIEEINIQLKDICAIVGENNNGKSAILKALNAFFNIKLEEQYFYNDTHRYNSRSRFSEIELTFENIPVKEIYNDKKTLDGKLIIRFKYNYSSKKYSYAYFKEKYIDLHSEVMKDILEEISFILIPANRDELNLIWSKNSLLKEVLIENLKQQTSVRDTLTPLAQRATKEMERLGFSKVEKNLNEYYSISKNFEINIGYSKNNDYSVLLDGIVVTAKENNTNFHITECGSGVQSMTVIALHRFLAKIKHRKIILGIDEPETNLHPQAQREFIKELKKESANIQTVVTTHSTTIIDQLQHEEVLLVRKVKDEIRGFKTVISQIKKDFWQKYDLQEFNYYQFHRYKNSEFFFAKLIVITESKNEVEVIKRLFLQKDIDLELQGVEFIDLGGVDRLKYGYSIVKELGIPYVILVDKDYFIPYINDNKLDESRDNSGFPKYEYSYKNQNKDLIDILISSKGDRERLLKMFRQGKQTQALGILEKYNIASMNYCLEMDLISVPQGEELYYKVLNIPTQNRSKNELLIGRKKAIKKIENIVSIVDRLPPRGLPLSYKNVRLLIEKKIKEL